MSITSTEYIRKLMKIQLTQIKNLRKTPRSESSVSDNSYNKCVVVGLLRGRKAKATLTSDFTVYGHQSYILRSSYQH